MPHPGVEPFIAVTDQDWFDYLASSANHGVLDEVNFWSPKATRPMKVMSPGLPASGSPTSRRLSASVRVERHP